MAQQSTLHLQSTRQEIIQHLQRMGRASVKELGSLLGLTSTGIRQHLTVLERDGLVKSIEERGRVGRPTLVYTLTDKAESLFPKNYDLLAICLLEEVRNSQGNEGLQQLLRQVAGRLAAPYLDRVEGKPVRERVKETVQIMQEQGCLVDYRQAGEDFFIEEYTCPYLRVAQHERAICVLHVEFVRALTSGDTRLTNSLMRGERACTYRIRPREPVLAKAN
ncbi:MAG TPA: winged helix-turn-helix transcriptional regulator [Dehalococcoidia bacterium]|nr:winged helix-turn-helix transcriptional regulator [Dehalococcoidia bacterium]